MQKKEKIFCRYYSWYRNPIESAKAAGYPDETAFDTASKLLEKQEIRQEIDHLDQSRRELNLEEAAIAGLFRIAFGNVNDGIRLVCQGGTENLENMDLFSVSEIKRGRDDSMEIKFRDRLPALEKLLELSDQGTGNEALYDLYQALSKTAGNEKNS